ncbi:DNA repair protein RadC [Chitinophaga barathri]|uniref:DNA repair protein RadC n=2 Tax=Chitinophaga barathri TaxID=1647451 RepID=A0A3N4M784_9BACT|nr:DNA repair protein RadC [Chitinophaga barathri]
MIVSPGLLPPISTYLPPKRLLPAIKHWAEEDRPCEKVLHNGVRTLSHAELLAILINCGNKTQSALELAKEILCSCGNNLSELSRLEVAQLQRFHGIGIKKAVRILAALELCRRKQISPLLRKPLVRTAREASAWLRPLLADHCCESFYVLFLNQANRLLHHACISTGGITSTTVDPRIVFGAALSHKATRLFLVHNHPSGNLRPSRADVSITRKLKEGGKMLDIAVVDHIIVTDAGYFSLLEDGLMDD